MLRIIFLYRALMGTSNAVAFLGGMRVVAADFSKHQQGIATSVVSCMGALGIF